MNEVHQIDYVGPCFLKGPVRFYSLNSVDLATGRCAISPVLSKAGQYTLDAIWSSWCRLGIPQNVQVDNELVFYGSRQYPRRMGILIRLFCSTTFSLGLFLWQNLGGMVSLKSSMITFKQDFFGEL